MNVETILLTALTFDPNNARKHDNKNIEAIAGSLKQFGQRKPIVITEDNIIVAGNGTVTAAKQLGWTDIKVVRVPKDWDANQIKAFALADNRTAELAEWDKDILAKQIIELQTDDWDTSLLGFGVDDDYLTENNKDIHEIGDENNKYTAKINLPQYEITGEKPELNELYDQTHAKMLAEQINSSEIPNNVKQFLLKAAERHTVFDYHKIAEFYAHAPKNIQELMEASALVIIDLDDAIKYGYAKFMNTIEELKDEDDDSFE